MQYRTPLILTALLILLWVGYALTRTPIEATEPTPKRPLVTTSIYPLEFLVRSIAGTVVEVKNITPIGTEPHDYEPSPKDMRQIAESALILLAGGGVEPWATDLSKTVDTKQVTIKQQLEATLPKGMITDDPHFWLSPMIMQEASRIVTAALIERFPEHEATFNRNETALLHSLDELDRSYQTGLATCTTRDLVTAHDAFRYLARDYNLETIAIAGISPDTEPSPQELSKIAALVTEKKVDVIFFEELVSPKYAQTIAGETGASTMVLDPIEGLTATGLNTGATYLSIMNANLSSLRKALNCSSL